MNVLIITRNYYPEPGAKSRRLKLLSEKFKSKSNQVVVITTQPSYGMEPNEAKGMKKNKDTNVIRLKHKHEKNIFKRYFKEQNLTSRIIERAKIEIEEKKIDLVYLELPPFSFSRIFTEIKKKKYQDCS